MTPINKNKFLKALVSALELLAMAIIIYLLVLPIWPALIYKFAGPGRNSQIDWQNLAAVKERTGQIIGRLPAAADNLTANRLIITKIGVNAPIVESKNPADGLSQGAWKTPESSTPDKGGNTVITGHRFKYLPPNNLTFFLLDKLTSGDLIALRWQNQVYYYRVKETKVVPAAEISILEPTALPTLTLYTCDPIFSTANRLVVVAELLP
ncbi:MAG: sortase [bacterium]|nr:sortase [bacterium]